MRRTLMTSFIFCLLGSMAFPSDLTKALKFVVIPEKGYEKDEYTLLSVSSINEGLSELSIEYVENEVVAKLRKKMEKIYEEKKGEGMTLSQLLATEVGGNVYVEVSVKVEEKKMETLKKAYQDVPAVDIKQVFIRITLSAYDASTGRGLGKTILSTNAPVAGNTSERVERLISKMSEDGLKEIMKKVNKYLEGGELVSVKVMGVKDISTEREISTSISTIPSVKMKKRKSMSDGYVEYEVVVKGSIGEFVDDLRDCLETVSGVGKLDITMSQNLIIVKIR
ncbi:MAG: DUF6175 family protein [Brevinematia bacterium]